MPNKQVCHYWIVLVANTVGDILARALISEIHQMTPKLPLLFCLHEIYTHILVPWGAVGSHAVPWGDMGDVG